MERIGTTEIIVLFFLLPIYFLPTIIAVNRKKTNTSTIILLNLFLGWTVIGWVITFIWSCSSDNSKPLITINNQKYILKKERIEFPRQSLHHKLENLRQLKDQFEAGTLSKKEYENEKEKLLGK